MLSFLEILDKWIQTPHCSIKFQTLNEFFAHLIGGYYFDTINEFLSFFLTPRWTGLNIDLCHSDAVSVLFATHLCFHAGENLFQDRLHVGKHYLILRNVFCYLSLVLYQVGVAESLLFLVFNSQNDRSAFVNMLLGNSDCVRVNVCH